MCSQAAIKVATGQHIRLGLASLDNHSVGCHEDLLVNTMRKTLGFGSLRARQRAVLISTPSRRDMTV
jgi:hypothetical protein